MKTSQWLRPFLFTLLILVAPLIGYYLYFVETREAVLLDRLHAHLANAAARVESRFESAFSVIRTNPDRSNELGVLWTKCAPRAAPDAATGEPPAASRQSRDRLCLRPGVLVDATVLVGDIDPERLFYDVVLVDDAQRVVFQRDPDKGRVRSGDVFSGKAQTADDDGTVRDPLLQMRVLYQGRPFLVFSQPLVTSADSGTPWTLVGLLEQPAFNSLKYDFRPGAIVLVIFALVGVVLAAPFLKLWYLGRFEPLTRFDLFLQTGAGLSLVALATVGLMAWWTYVHLSGYFGQRLEQLSTVLAAQIVAEHRDAVIALERLEAPMVSAYQARSDAGALRDESSVEGCPAIASLPDDSAMGRLPAGTAPVLRGDLLAATDGLQGFRQLKMAYLMDQRGCQLVKWSSEGQWTRPGEFGDRAYFLRALPDARTTSDLYQIDIGRAEPRGYFHDAIVSRTTGERSVVFSRPVHGKEAACGAAVEHWRQGAEDDPRLPCVSVVSATLQSLDSVLPAGFGALLVDDAGNIVARSSDDRSTERNLAAEIDDPNRLQSILASVAVRGAPETFSTDYRRDTTRFRVTPLPLGGLTLVTFHAFDPIDITVLEALGGALTSWFFWISVLIALSFALWIADDLTEKELRRRTVYFLLGIGLFVVMTIPALAIEPMLLLSVGGIPLTLLALRLLAREEKSQLNVLLRRGAVVAVTWASVMLAAALPMSVFYRDAETRTLDGLIRNQQLAHGRALARQDRAFETWKHAVGLGDDPWSGFDVWVNRGLVDHPAWDAPAEVTPRTCGLDLICHVLANLPDYSPQAAALHAMYRVRGDDDDAIREMRTTLLAGPAASATVWVSTVLIFLVISPVVIWYLLVRTLGLRTENVLVVTSFLLPAADQPARFLIYGAPQARRRARYFEMLPAADKRWYDLRDVAPGASLAVPTEADAVVLDHFDANLADPAVLTQRVELLERLLREERRVILLLISIEPLNFVTYTYPSEPNAALLARFASVLARFTFTYHDASEEDRMRQEDPAADWRTALVYAECRHPDLWPIRDGLLREPGLQRWSKRQIVQQVNSRANALFQTMWYQSTRIEKFTLIQLARGNPVNPNNWDATRRLKTRGQVVSDPFHRLASESLRLFVLRMERIENVEGWRNENPGAWGQIKVPLVLLIVTGLIFVAIAQPNLFNSLFAFAAAGAASFPLLVSALNARLQRAAQS